MHIEAHEFMKWFVDNFVKLEKKPLTILDVGSLDINGNYRDLFTDVEWLYVGLDIVSGNNVDVISPDLYHYSIPDNAYDLVISGQCIEHVEDIYAWADEIIRILKPGGLMCVMAPNTWTEHRCPLDCWRFYPDGFRWLFVKRTKKMTEIEIAYNDNSSYAILRKNKD